MNKRFAAVGAFVGSLGLTISALVGAAPVAAGDAPAITMYAVDWTNSTPLYSVNPATAASTAIGSGITGLNSANAAAWNPTTGNVTVLQSTGIGNCEIWDINPTTGAGSKTFDVTWTEQPLFDCWGMAYGPDQKLYIGYRSNTTPRVVYLVSVNQTTGAVIESHYTDNTMAGSFNFIVSDFTSGLMYFQSDGSKQDLFSFDPVTETVTNITNAGSRLSPFYGAAIAPSGEIFLSTWGGLATIASWAAFPTNTYIGNTTGNTTGIVIEVDYPVSVEAPTAPQTASAAARNTGAYVEWTAPSDNGGADITAYKVEYSTDGTNWTTASSSITDLNYKVTGLTNGTAYSFRVSAYNGTEWSEPSTTASATPNTDANLLGPVPPATELPLGDSALTEDGSDVEVTVEPNSESNPTSLDISGEGFSMSLAGTNRNNQPLGLTAEGALILESDRFASVQGTGFKPNSEVKLYIYSSPRYIGSVMTDDNGNFSGSLQIPLNLLAGLHNLQANGFTPDDRVRSLTIGVLVRDSVVKRLTAAVHFDDSSAVLTATAKKTLRALVAKRKNLIDSVRVTGYVQASASSANDKSLSAARAKVVKKFLKALGVKATFTLKAAGTGSTATSKDRRSSVSITFGV